MQWSDDLGMGHGPMCLRCCITRPQVQKGKPGVKAGKGGRRNTKVGTKSLFGLTILPCYLPL